MKKYSPIIMIPSPKILKKRMPPDTAIETTFEALCLESGIKNRVIGYETPCVFLDPCAKDDFIFYTESNQKKYLIGTANIAEDEVAARVIERLAYGFFDYAAKESARGVFRF